MLNSFLKKKIILKDEFYLKFMITIILKLILMLQFF